MMDREVLVYVDLEGKPHLRIRRGMAEKSGQVFTRTGAATRPRSLSHAGRYADVRRDRRLGTGPVGSRPHAPHGNAPRALREIDFLLLVDDEARLGALRFAEKEGGPLLREEGVKRIPSLVELPKLLAAAEHVM